MEKAAFILAGGIMVSITAVIAVIGLIIVNNLLSKFWKPITWVKYDYQTIQITYNETTGEYARVDHKLKELNGTASRH